MKISTFDTTLRDGTQGEAVSFSVDDKLVIAQKLDELGIDYIEGGYPGANATDTEFLAERTGAKRAVMMLVGGPAKHLLRVALATTHLPLAAVPAAITRPGLEEILRVVAADLVGKFGVARPRIAVCGLNPHAGEGGHLGREEIETIEPAIAAARAAGLDVTGPLPADTVFVPAKLSGFDCIVAMYHDQGLPVLKHVSFGHGVNVTLGLPILRTSVDHGTALDLAADGRSARAADPGSLFAAVGLAIELSRRET